MSTGNDTTFTKIFVGGLPYHTTDQSLREFFDQFGSIEEAVVITDRQTNKSRGYGFVTMSNSLAAEKACEDPNPIIDGRKANVNLAYLGAKPRALPMGFQQIDPLTMKAADYSGYCAAQVPVVPQYRYMYPAAAYMTSQSMLPMMQQAAQQHVQSPVSPVAAVPRSPVIMDYTPTAATAAGLATGQQLPMGYEAYQYANAAGHMTPAAYPYMTAAGLQASGHMTLLHQSQAMQDKLREYN